MAKEEVEIKRLAQIASRYDVDNFLSALETMKDCTDPDIILTTAHKSKGLEYDYVVVADDFKFGDIDALSIPEQELNLLYVACTRAKLELQLPRVLQEYMEELHEV